jgi:N-acyl amino acid synthase of PEP-CTERM/exosortase system
VISTDLHAEFGKYFCIQRASSAELRDEAFHIRHKVYCEELAFEPVRSDARERDEHDDHAEHILIRTVEGRVAVGCARVIIPAAADYILPVERTAAWRAERPLLDQDGRPRAAELSRLAVVRQFRRRAGEQSRAINLSEADFGTPLQPRFPHIPVGLYLGALAIACERSVATLVVLTEAHLAKHFGRLGVRLEQVGDAVEFHRLRAPYAMQVRQTVDNLPDIVRPLYDVIEAEILGLRDDGRAYASAHGARRPP